MADIDLRLPWKADDLAEDYARNQLDREWAEYKRRLEQEGGGPEVVGAPGQGTEDAPATTLPEITSLETAPREGAPAAPAGPSALVEGAKAAGETVVSGVQHLAAGMFEDRPGQMLLGGMEIASALPAGVGTAVQQALKTYAPGMEAATAIPEGDVAGLLRTFLATPGLLLDPAQAKAMEEQPQELAADLKKPVTFGELANILSQIATPFAGKAARKTAAATKEQLPNILSERGSIGPQPPPEGAQYRGTGGPGSAAAPKRVGLVGEPGAAGPPEFLKKNPHVWREGSTAASRAAEFDALPPDAEVWVFHGTDKATAADMAAHGIDPAKKPRALGRERLAAGEEARFGPGAGLGEGLYVATDPFNAEGFGREILAIRVKKSQLGIPPEQTSLGERSVGTALSLSDAQIVGPVPADRIRRVTGPDAHRLTAYGATEATATGEPPVPPGMVRLYRGEGTRTGGPVWNDPKMNELAGRWFTDDKALAGDFADRADLVDRTGALLYVDVPAEVAQQARGIHPTVDPGAAPERGQHLLPPEWAGKAQPLPAGRQLPPPPEGAEARINLGRQQAPEPAKQIMEDISKIISTRPAIAASRERVTHAETIAEAAKWKLDQVLGVEPGDITLAQVRGFQLAARDYFNAASQHLDDLAKRTAAGDAQAAAQWDAAELILGRLAELQEMPGTELGRALESRKIEATVERAKGFTPEAIQRIAAMQSDPSVPPAVRAAQYMALGTKAQRGEFLRQKWAAVVRLKDIAHELWINNLLTNPATHAANVTGTGMSVAWNLPEHWVAEIVNKLFTRDPEGVQRGETAAMIRAIPQGLSDGIRLAQKAAAKELGKGTELTGVEQTLIQQTHVEIDQKLPAILRIPTIALGIEDAAAKGLTYRMELSALALRQARNEGKIGPALDARVRDLEAHPPAPMIAEAVDAAMLRTLNAQLGPAGQTFMKWANQVPGGRLIMPFIRTPTNAAKWFGQRAPILGQLSAQNWRDVMAGGAARDKALARQAVGMSVSAVVMWEVAQGNITGAGDPDRRLKSVEREERPAYSIRVGDTWYSYSRTDPVGALIGLLADYAEITGRIPTQDDYDHWAAYGEGIALAVGQVMVNKTYMRGLADVLEAMKDPQRNVGKVTSGWARSLVPAGVRAATRQMDDNILRDTRGLLDEIKAGIPFWAESLPPERNPITGEPIRFPPGWGPDMLSPIYVTEKRNDPVFEEVLANRIVLPLVPRYIGPGERTEGPMTQEPRGGQRSQKLTPKQRDYWMVAMTQLAKDGQGQTLHQALTTLVRSQKYQDQSEGSGGGRDVLIRETYKAFMDRGEMMLRRESPTLEGRIRELQEQKVRRMLPKTDPRSPQYGVAPSLTR